MSLHRRVFLISTAATCATAALGVRAQTLVDEKDGQAVARGHAVDLPELREDPHARGVRGQHGAGRVRLRTLGVGELQHDDGGAYGATPSSGGGAVRPLTRT